MKLVEKSVLVVRGFQQTSSDEGLGRIKGNNWSDIMKYMDKCCLILDVFRNSLILQLPTCMVKESQH